MSSETGRGIDRKKTPYTGDWIQWSAERHKALFGNRMPERTDEHPFRASVTKYAVGFMQSRMQSFRLTYHGISIEGSVLYCNTKPCSICAKMLCNAGIVKVIYESYYDDPLADEMFYEKRIQLIKYEKGTF